ncbi:MAG: hypothetical protein A2600_05695 [Candidatus Lambdaproteobacteria bacterium RIFOXYD1_FULL_56_27]|uniref:Uncharacterized protein n=1 Tax=Candidatus Lambdaproteobacteria bacterium RIFOXYD2_FULL_56_26 TaxID=1817773 RepID=A0A1F6GRB4_9PROT|nr:MAG: hypothetical protein A2426_10900 [Candidatus Lambdaproteobacteria bacterium RIFOXYC1_FULL_56_13]OGH00693.1 MAG: hypothetical protein A2557_03400 [Candidatus Lambdaproteobacteria bacterium RIFOXYD2_FULL_56_26]OGH07860.1 MAG: hypothetical protein A2600_05695 [Candidatus Lambdaproteobacteria bacterium RIFOXYD1_FULL_56_27]
MDNETFKNLIPTDWLAPYYNEYLSLNEKITTTLIQVTAHQRQWGKTLHRPQDFEEFFEAEAEVLGKSVEEIKGFFQQIAQTKAKEQVFEKHYGHLVPKDEKGHPKINRKALDSILGPDMKFKTE